MIKAFKTIKAAYEAANGGPILKVEAYDPKGRNTLYIVGIPQDDAEQACVGIELLDRRDRTAAHVTYRHLRRLGNANHALTKDEAPEWVAKHTEPA